MKKFISAIAASLMIINLAGCSWSDPESTANDGVFRIAMVPDMGGKPIPDAITETFFSLYVPV